MNATVVALNERTNIYIVIDERGQTIGTGSREVCEVLARLSTQTASRTIQPFVRSTRVDDNIRSAIKL